MVEDFAAKIQGALADKTGSLLESLVKAGKFASVVTENNTSLHRFVKLVRDCAPTPKYVGPDNSHLIDIQDSWQEGDVVIHAYGKHEIMPSFVGSVLKDAERTFGKFLAFRPYKTYGVAADKPGILGAVHKMTASTKEEHRKHRDYQKLFRTVAAGLLHDQNVADFELNGVWTKTFVERVTILTDALFARAYPVYVVNPEAAARAQSEGGL